jgi:hypothetical protein
MLLCAAVASSTVYTSKLNLENLPVRSGAVKMRPLRYARRDEETYNETRRLPHHPPQRSVGSSPQQRVSWPILGHLRLKGLHPVLGQPSSQ